MVATTVDASWTPANWNTDPTCQKGGEEKEKENENSNH